MMDSAVSSFGQRRLLNAEYINVTQHTAKSFKDMEVFINFIF